MNIDKSDKTEVGFMPIEPHRSHSHSRQRKWQKYVPLVSAALVGSAFLLLLAGFIEAAMLAAVFGLVSIILETAEFKS